MRILRDHAADIAKLIPEGAALVEFGSGSNKKARMALGSTQAFRTPIIWHGNWRSQAAACPVRSFSTATSGNGDP
jgi:hypothetical protein